jgi:hypothetical protein
MLELQGNLVKLEKYEPGRKARDDYKRCNG